MATKTPTRTKTPSVKPNEVVAEVEQTVETPFNAFMEHQRVALRETSNALQALLPKEVQEHTRSAYKEAVEGYRGLFNAVIDDIVENIEKIKLPTGNKN